MSIGDNLDRTFASCTLNDLHRFFNSSDEAGKILLLLDGFALVLLVQAVDKEFEILIKLFNRLELSVTRTATIHVLVQVRVDVTITAVSGSVDITKSKHLKVLIRCWYNHYTLI